MDDCADALLVCSDAGHPPTCVCAPPEAEIVVFPGPGSAALIRSGGRTVLVGTGHARRDLLNYIRREGIRRIDCLAVPRDSREYAAGCERLIDYVRIDRVLVPARTAISPIPVQAAAP